MISTVYTTILLSSYLHFHLYLFVLFSLLEKVIRTKELDQKKKKTKKTKYLFVANWVTLSQKKIPMSLTEPPE